MCKNDELDKINSLAPTTCSESLNVQLYTCDSTCKTQYYVQSQIKDTNQITQTALQCQDSCSYNLQKNFSSNLVQCVEKCSDDRVLVLRECSSMCPQSRPYLKISNSQKECLESC